MFFINKGYFNNDDCPCVFIRKSSYGFCIISLYVNDLNIIGTELDINEARNHIKTEFKIKDLGKIFKKNLRFTPTAPSYGHSRTSIDLCPEKIREIPYG
jgi:hypothetical protein